MVVNSALDKAILRLIPLEAIYPTRLVFDNSQKRFGMHFVFDVPAIQLTVDAKVDFNLAFVVGEDVDVGSALADSFHQRGLEEVDQLGAVDLGLEGLFVDQLGFGVVAGA